MGSSRLSHGQSVTHPFFSMLVATRSIAHDHDQLVDAYLEPWAAYGARADLRAALDLALRLGPITRALAWNRVLAGLPPDAAGEWGDALDAWLRDLETELGRP